MIKSNVTILIIVVPLVGLSLIFLAAFLSSTSDSPGGDTSYKVISKHIDIGSWQIKRQLVRIEIPEGRTRKDVEATFKRAVKESYAAGKKPDALSVQGLRPQDDKTGAYTIGEAVYAPNGEWAQAADKSAPMEIKITLGTIYFKPKKVIFEKGTMVEFVSSKGTDIEIFKTPGNWRDENIYILVKPGQTGKILESETFATTEMSLTEYRIEINGKVGWTTEGAVKAAND